MVDEIENKNSDSDLEADFPSFLRSDNPENQEHDINHFLEDDTSAESQAEVPQTLSSWNDGFDEADKADGSADWDLDLGDINTPIESGIIFFLVSFFHLIIKNTINEGIIEKKLEK